jgi:hypothetical protein
MKLPSGFKNTVDLFSKLMSVILRWGSISKKGSGPMK